MDRAIIVRGLSKRYPTGAEALKDIHLEIRKGQFFALLGPNGAGKSTLMRVLTALIPKDFGEFRIGDLNPETDFPRIQRLIGVASQDNELDPVEKVEAQLRFQGRLFGMSKAEAELRAESLLEQFHLGALRRERAGNLSGGNKRRLHCALALVHSPLILFLDEPTVGMDPAARSDFWEVITRMNRTEGVTVFMTTQYLEEAERHAEDMAFLVEGSLRYSGSIRNFTSRVSSGERVPLEESYLRYLEQISSRPLGSVKE